jgi:hypothetical protein
VFYVYFQEPLKSHISVLERGGLESKFLVKQVEEKFDSKNHAKGGREDPPTLGTWGVAVGLQ